MLLYFCIAFVLLIALIVSITDCRNNNELIKGKICFNKWIYNFSFISLILLFWFLTAFRGRSIGNDTKIYLMYYERIATSGVDANLQLELGYQYFCLFLSKINPDPFFLIIVTATICYAVCGICIYAKSDNILYSTLLLFCIAFSLFTNVIRQSIAMSIVLIAYLMIKGAKKIFPVVLILLASQFHISALVTLLWLVHKYMPKKPMIVLPLTLVVAVLAISGSINSILACVLTEYKGYFSSISAGTGRLGVFYYTLRALAFYSFIYTASMNNGKGNSHPRLLQCSGNIASMQQENSLEIANTIFLLITVCLGFSVNQFNRASSYFLLMLVIDIPKVCNSGKIKNRTIWMLIIGIIMLAYFLLVLIVRPEWNHIYPYEFNWN